MANNRLYLRHKRTGETLAFAKSMGAGWYVVATTEQIDEFFGWALVAGEHGGCGAQTELDLITEYHPDHQYPPALSLPAAPRAADS